MCADFCLNISFSYTRESSKGFLLRHLVYTKRRKHIYTIRKHETTFTWWFWNAVKFVYCETVYFHYIFQQIWLHSSGEANCCFDYHKQPKPPNTLLLELWFHKSQAIKILVPSGIQTWDLRSLSCIWEQLSVTKTTRCFTASDEYQCSEQCLIAKDL